MTFRTKPLARRAYGPIPGMRSDQFQAAMVTPAKTANVHHLRPVNLPSPLGILKLISALLIAKSFLQKMICSFKKAGYGRVTDYVNGVVLHLAKIVLHIKIDFCVKNLRKMFSSAISLLTMGVRTGLRPIIYRLFTNFTAIRLYRFRISGLHRHKPI